MAFDYSQYDDAYLWRKAEEAYTAGHVDWAEDIRAELWRREDEGRVLQQPEERQANDYNWAEGIGASTAGMVAGTLSGLTRAATRPQREVLGLIFGKKPEEVKIQGLTEFADSMQAAAEDLKQEGYLSQGGDNFFTQLVTSTIQMAPSVAVGRYTKNGNAGLITMGGVVYSTTLASALAAGKSEKEATKEAIIQTAFELGPEKAFGFFDNLPIAAGAKQWLKQSVAEALSEVGTEELNMLYEEHVEGKPVSARDRWVRDFQAFAAGFTMGGTLGSGALSKKNRQLAQEMQDAGVITTDRWRPGAMSKPAQQPEDMSEEELAIGRYHRYAEEDAIARLQEELQQEEDYLESLSTTDGYDPAETAAIEEEARAQGVTGDPRMTEEELATVFTAPQRELDLTNPADQREATWREANAAATQIAQEERAAWEAFRQRSQQLDESYDEAFNIWQEDVAERAEPIPQQGTLDLGQRPTPRSVLGPSRTEDLTRDVSEAPAIGQAQLDAVDTAVESLSVEQLLDEYVNVSPDPEAAERDVAQYYNGQGIFGTPAARNKVVERAKDEVKQAWAEPLQEIIKRNAGVNVTSEELEWYKNLPYEKARNEVDEETLQEADKDGNTEFTDKDRQTVEDFSQEAVGYYKGTTGGWRLIGFNPETGRVFVEYRANRKDKNGEQTYLRYYWNLGEGFAPKKLLKNGEWDAQWRNRQRKNLQTKNLRNHIPRNFRVKLENALGGYMEGEARTGSRRMRRMQPEQWITPQTEERAIEFEAARRIKARRAEKRAEQYKEPTPAEIRAELNAMREEGILPKTPKPAPVKRATEEGATEEVAGLYETTTEAVEKEAGKYRTRARQRLIARQKIDTTLTEEELAQERAAAEQEMRPRQQRTVERVKAEMAARFTGKTWNRPKEWKGFPKFEEDGAAAEQIVTLIEDQGVINQLNAGTAVPQRVVQVLPSGQIRVLEIVPTEVGEPYTIQVRSMGRNNYVTPRVMGTIGKAYKESAANKLLAATGVRGDTADAAILKQAVKKSWTAPTEQDRLIEEMEKEEIGTRPLDQKVPKKKKKPRKKPVPEDQLRPEEYRQRQQLRKLREQIADEKEDAAQAKQAWQAAVKAGRPEEEIKALRAAFRSKEADLRTSRSLYNTLRDEGVVPEDAPDPGETFEEYVNQLRRDREVRDEDRLTPEERWPLVREIIDRRTAEKNLAAMDKLVTRLVQDGRFGTRAGIRNRIKAELQTLESALLDSFDNILRSYYRTDVADYISRGEPSQDDYVGDAYQPLYPGSGQVDLTATGNAQRAAVRGMVRTILRENPQIYNVLLENSYLRKRLGNPNLTEAERSNLEQQYYVSAQQAQVVVDHLGSVARSLKEFLVTANPEVIGGVAMTQEEAEGRRARGTAWDITITAKQARDIYKVAAARSEAASEMMVPTEIIRDIRKTHGLEEFTKDDLLPYIRRRSMYSKAITKKELDQLDDTAERPIESPYIQHGQFEFGLAQFQADQARLESGATVFVPGVSGGTIFANEPFLDQLYREFAKAERAAQGETDAAALSGELMQTNLDRMRASVQRDAEVAAEQARQAARQEMERTAEEMGRLREERDAARREAEQARGEEALRQKERELRQEAAREDAAILRDEVTRQAAEELAQARLARQEAADRAREQARLERSNVYREEVARAIAEEEMAERAALEEQQANQLELILTGRSGDAVLENRATEQERFEQTKLPPRSERLKLKRAQYIKERTAQLLEDAGIKDIPDAPDITMGSTAVLTPGAPGAPEFEAAVAMDSLDTTRVGRVKNFLSYWGSRNLGLQKEQRGLLKLFPRAIGKIQGHVNFIMDQWSVARAELEKAFPDYKRFNTTYDNAITDYLQDMSAESVLVKHGVDLPASVRAPLDKMKAEILLLGKMGIERGAWDSGSVIAAVLNQRGYLHRTAKQTKRTRDQLRNINAKLAELAKKAWNVPTQAAEMMSMSDSKVLAMLSDKTHRLFDDYLSDVEVAHPNGKTHKHKYLTVGNLKIDLGKPNNGVLTKKVLLDQLRRENPDAAKEELAALAEARMNKVRSALSEHLPTDETYRKAVALLSERMLQDFEQVASGRWVGKGGDVSIKRARQVMKSDADLIAQATDTLWQNAPEEIRKEVKEQLENNRERNRTKSFREFLMSVKASYPNLGEAIAKAEAQYEFSQALRAGLNEVTDPETAIFDTANRLAESVYTSDLLMNVMKMGVEQGWASYKNVGTEGVGWESLAPEGTKLGETPVAIPGAIDPKTGNPEYIYAKDIRVPAEVAKAMREALGVNKEESWELFKGLRKASIYTKWGLVIGSVGGQARNFVSTTLIHLTRNPVGYGWLKAHKMGQALARHQAYKGMTRKKRAKGANKAEEDKQLQRAKRLEQIMLDYGMLYDGGKAGALWDIRRKGMGATSQRTAGFHRLGEKGAQAANAAEEMFRLSDEWVKMPAFMMRTYEYLSYMGYEQSLLDQVLDGEALSTADKAKLQEAMDMASEAVLDEYPTFSRINKIGKMLSRNPVIGAFPGFQFEMIRTTKNAFNNNWRLMMGELPNGKKIPEGQRAAARAMGAIRVSMTLASVSALSVLSQVLLSLVGDDDEETRLLQQTGGEWDYAKRLVRGILPWWAKDTQVAVRDVDRENGTYSVLRMDYLWATGGLESAARTATSRIMRAMADEDSNLAKEIMIAAWEGVQPIAFNQEPFLDNIRKRYVRQNIDTRQKDKWTLRHAADVIDRTLGGDSDGWMGQLTGAVAGGTAESLLVPLNQIAQATKFVYEGVRDYPEEGEVQYVKDLALRSAGFFSGLKLESKEFVTDLAPQIKRDIKSFGEITTSMKRRLLSPETSSEEDVRSIVHAYNYKRKDKFDEIHAGIEGSRVVLGVPPVKIEHYVESKTAGGITFDEFGAGKYSLYSPEEFDSFVDTAAKGVDPENPNESITPLTRERAYNLKSWYRTAYYEMNSGTEFRNE